MITASPYTLILKTVLLVIQTALSLPEMFVTTYYFVYSVGLLAFHFEAVSKSNTLISIGYQFLARSQQIKFSFKSRVNSSLE